VRTQILLMDPLPSLNKVCSLVTQQERQIFGDQSKAMIATSKSKFQFRCFQTWNDGYLH